MFSELVRKSIVFNENNYAWLSVDSCSDYKYLNFHQITYFKVVMHRYKLYSIYPRNHELAKDFQKVFSSLIFENVYLPVPRLSSRMTVSGLNNGRSKLGVVNMSICPLPLNVETL